MSNKSDHYAARRADRPVAGNDPGIERALSTGALTSGLPYQRVVDQREVDRLVREWDDRLLDPLVVSYRDGKYNVVDGQHRVSAMRRRNGGREVMARCKIFYGLTYEQEAALCWKLDKAKKRLSLSQSTNALIEAGLDGKAAAIRRLMGERGFTWALGRKTGADYEIAATRAVLNAYRLLEEAGFARMLHLLDRTWNGDHRALTAPILSGLALFLHTYEAELSDAIFIKRLSAVDPEEIVRRGRADFSTGNAALRYARVLLEKYNGAKGGKKLSYRFGI